MEKLKINTINELLSINFDNVSNIVYFSENLIKNNNIKTINNAYNIFLNSIIENKSIEESGYSVQSIFLDGKKYFKVEKIDLIEKNEKELVLNLLEKEFGDNLISVGIFGSFITKEDGEYSDYDLVIMLKGYKNDNIYEREKVSPKLKKKLKEHGVKSLFAFNFTTEEELKNANKNNPWLLETMGKSFYILKDKDNKLENLLTSNRNIKYLGNFVWEGEKLNTKENLNRVNLILKKYEKIFNIAINNNFKDFSKYYKWEIIKMKIIKKLLEEKSLFVSRFNFDFICKEILDLEENEINNLYNIYKKSEIEGKKSIQNYTSSQNNLDFSKKLESENLELPSLEHTYFALKNILSELLHKTGNFILDGEFTQKFLQIFGNNLPDNINKSFYENVFKTEQILGRDGYLSFDLNSDGSYIFENGNFDYNALKEKLKELINFFIKNKDNLLNKIGINKTNILVISKNNRLLTNNFIFPNNINYITFEEKNKLENNNFIKNSEYIAILNSKNSFSADYLLKLLSGFNKKGIKCVSGNRVSKVKGAKNKFDNFIFKKEDFELEGKEIFKYSLRNVGTNYFTS